MTTLRHPRDIATDLVLTPGGATVPLIVGQRVPDSGYVVGQYGTTLSCGALSVRQVREWVESVQVRAAYFPGQYVGIWVHEDTVYLDVVKIYSEAVPAFQDAAKRGELAVWDIAAGKEIYARDYAMV